MGSSRAIRIAAKKSQRLASKASLAQALRAKLVGITGAQVVRQMGGMGADCTHGRAVGRAVRRGCLRAAARRAPRMHRPHGNGRVVGAPWQRVPEQGLEAVCARRVNCAGLSDGDPLAARSLAHRAAEAQ
eukprot:2221937-Pyramimonas_sp.AAC.1